MSADTLPGQDKQSEGITCSSCGRFVGALTRCPHCGARVEKRMSVKFFRYAAVLLATVGLGFLYLMSTHKDVPVIKISEVSPMMNFAYVRVKGVVSGDVRVYKEGGRVQSLRFPVDDGTGEIPVTAYRAQAEYLLAHELVPRMGDDVDVAGSLSVSADDRLLLRVQVPEHIKLARVELPVTRLGDLSADDSGGSALVEGVITRVSAPRPGSRAPWTVKIRDDSGEQEMNFWEDTYADIKDKILLAPGTFVRARVGIGTYRGELQLKLGRGTDLEFPSGKGVGVMTAGPGAPAPEPEKVPLASVTPELSGREVCIEGKVVDVRTPREGSRAPHTIELEDGGSRVSVVYWDTVAQHLGDQAPARGAWMRAIGTVNVYRDRVQVKVEHSNKLSLSEIPPVAAAPDTKGQSMAIAEITAAMQGQNVTVHGTLGEPRSVRGGVIYPLTDEGGSIQVVLWDRSVPGAERNHLQAGLKVAVSGAVKEYRGALEVIPASPRDIVVEGSGVTP
ncbi:MAG: hypothetical protein JXB04_07075 [Kiritimatiellae bacterium]|nr:hypothetical protein [Kiritimatiellia bacterium]